MQIRLARIGLALIVFIPRSAARTILLRVWQKVVKFNVAKFERNYATPISFEVLYDSAPVRMWLSNGEYFSV